METISIRNWSKFQHYTKRSPPWIRLYNSLLEEPEFICLPDASKFHLIGLFLIAARTDNKIPADPKYLQRILQSDKPPNLILLAENGWFLGDASNLPATCLLRAESEQSRAEQKTLATSRNGERTNGQNGSPPPGFQAWWTAYRKALAPRPMRDKPKCLEIWKALKAEEHAEKIVAKLNRQASYRQSSEQSGQFIPNLPDPIRYLKRKLWQEEIPS